MKMEETRRRRFLFAMGRTLFSLSLIHNIKLKNVKKSVLVLIDNNFPPHHENREKQKKEEGVDRDVCISKFGDLPKLPSLREIFKILLAFFPSFAKSNPPRFFPKSAIPLIASFIQIVKTKTGGGLLSLPLVSSFFGFAVCFLCMGSTDVVRYCTQLGSRHCDLNLI